MISIKGLTTATIKDIVRDLNEPNTKQYFEYDVDGDVIAIYKAQASAADGDVCLKQVFEYFAFPAGKAIQKISWTDSIWNIAWDIV